MASGDSRVTIHMAASLDGFIARRDGSVDWLETSDEFAGGETLSPELYSGDLAELLDDRLRPRFRSVWVVGGGAVAGECLRRGLADELYYSILPVLIGDGISFFESLDRDVALHLAGVKAYKSGTVELRYEVREPRRSAYLR